MVGDTNGWALSTSHRQLRAELSCGGSCSPPLAATRITMTNVGWQRDTEYENWQFCSRKEKEKERKKENRQGN